MLIQATSGKYYNTLHIRWLKMVWHKGGARDLGFFGQYADGTEFSDDIGQAEYDRISTHGDSQPQLVPSPPGYFLLRYWLNEDGTDEVDREPVLAWQFDGELGFHGVFTAFEYPNGGDCSQHILCPDGRVVNCGNAIFNDVDKWTKDMRELTLYARERERKAKEEKAKLKAVET